MVIFPADVHPRALTIILGHSLYFFLGLSFLILFLVSLFSEVHYLEDS